MGIADRDYTRADYRGRSSVGVLHMWSVNTWLIVINVAVFVVNNVLQLAIVRNNPYTGQAVAYPLLSYFGEFTVSAAIGHFQIWRFITYQFLHADMMHILFNMFALYMFGQLIESYLGRRRYLAFYLLSGIGGGVLYVILTMLGFFGAARISAQVPLVGASAGIFGVLIAAAQIAPDATVLIYGAIPARLKTVAWVLLGIAVLAIFGFGGNAGGQAAHLGGAVVGFFLIRSPQVLNIFEYGYDSHRRLR
jgi:membrane associated rhomboid family serine protease